MTDCSEEKWLFQELGYRKVEVDFGGGYLSSDGGGLILRELERHSGLVRDFADCFVDYRDQRYVEHSVQELVSQRIHGLVLGYEDLNDHDHLRRDPIHGLICGKNDPLGQDRVLERDKGKALAAHSTLNRLELSAQAIDARYRKIQAQPDKIQELLIKRGVKAIPRKSAEIVLDLDATDDPLHGSQEGAYFHGYYRDYCYLPLYCFCGNIPLSAQLRDCKRDASDGTVEALQKIVPAIRQRFGNKVRIIVRAERGHAGTGRLGVATATYPPRDSDPHHFSHRPRGHPHECARQHYAAAAPASVPPSDADLPDVQGPLRRTYSADIGPRKQKRIFFYDLTREPLQCLIRSHFVFYL